MELFVSHLLRSLVQIWLYTLLPFMWWLIFARKKEMFLSWIGLKGLAVDDKKPFYQAALLIVVGFLILSNGILWMMRGVETAASAFTGMGIAALPAALVYSFLTTALPEEILFRGFILKRLMNRFGFGIANLVQSFLFGLMHGIMFFSLIGLMQAFVVVIFTGGIGWSMGYINEKKANGSILPSWVIHGLANLYSAVIAMFSVL